MCAVGQVITDLPIHRGFTEDVSKVLGTAEPKGKFEVEEVLRGLISTQKLPVLGGNVY